MDRNKVFIESGGIMGYIMGYYIMVIMIQWINYPLEKERFGNIKNPACKQRLMRQAFGGLEHILEQ